MYDYNHYNFLESLNSILEENLSQQALIWLKDKADQITKGNRLVFYGAFTAVPRYTGKAPLNINVEDHKQISNLLPDFTLAGYAADRLSRVWLLLHWPIEDKENYLNTITGLFKAAEMNEQVALYGALPLLAYSEEWIAQCAEGIRSNIGIVLEAIMCNNPYPSAYLPQPAWNQLVLKAFFTEKPVYQIIGLDERANCELAYILSDYAHERWAAKRGFDPQLWRLTAKFIDERIYPDIEKTFVHGNQAEINAAALACYQSDFIPAKNLLDKNPVLKSAIETNRSTWNSLTNGRLNLN